MKKIFCVAMAVLMAGSVFSSLANESITMYALDGRTISVDSEAKDVWKAVGWYELPPVTMYALNGKTLIVPGDKVEAYLNVGWYKNPPETVYALDGRVKKVPPEMVEAYINVGWHREPPVAMIAADGRILYVAEKDVEAYKNVGWFIYVHPSEYGAAYVKNIRSVIDTYGFYENGGLAGLKYGVLLDFERDMVPELVLLHDLKVEVYRYENGVSSKIYETRAGGRYLQTDVSYTIALNEKINYPCLITYHTEYEWLEEKLHVFTIKDGKPSVKTLLSRINLAPGQDPIDFIGQFDHFEIDGNTVEKQTFKPVYDNIMNGKIEIDACWEIGYDMEMPWNYVRATRDELLAFLRQFGL